MVLEKIGLIIAPESFWLAKPEGLKEICNGCGAKGWMGLLVPDTVWFLRITDA